MQAPVQPIPQAAPSEGFTGIESLFAPRKAGPEGSDVHPIRAEYQIPPFSYELRADRAVDCIVGDSVRLVQARGVPGSRWQVTRAPVGSKVSIDGGAPTLVPDVAGLYVVTCTLPGSWRRDILIAAFPPDALDLTVYPPSMGMERRMRLRGVLHDPNVTADSIIAGLEGPAIDLATLAGYAGKKRGAFRMENYR